MGSAVAMRALERVGLFDCLYDFEGPCPKGSELGLGTCGGLCGDTSLLPPLPSQPPLSPSPPCNPLVTFVFCANKSKQTKHAARDPQPLAVAQQHPGIFGQVTDRIVWCEAEPANPPRYPCNPATKTKHYELYSQVPHLHSAPHMFSARPTARRIHLFPSPHPPRTTSEGGWPAARQL